MGKWAKQPGGETTQGKMTQGRMGKWAKRPGFNWPSGFGEDLWKWWTDKTDRPWLYYKLTNEPWANKLGHLNQWIIIQYGFKRHQRNAKLCGLSSGAVSFNNLSVISQLGLGRYGFHLIRFVSRYGQCVMICITILLFMRKSSNQSHLVYSY